MRDKIIIGVLSAIVVLLTVLAIYQYNFNSRCLGLIDKQEELIYRLSK